MFLPFHFTCEPLMLQCFRALLLSCFIRPTFFLLYSCVKTLFTSLAFLLSYPFQGVSSKIIILLNTISIDNSAKYVTAQVV